MQTPPRVAGILLGAAVLRSLASAVILNLPLAPGADPGPACPVGERVGR